MANPSALSIIGALTATAGAVTLVRSRRAVHLATKNRSFTLILDYGSAISELVLTAVLQSLPGVDSFTYDGKQVLKVNGLVPISTVISRFTKVGTHFEVDGEPEVIVNVSQRRALAARRALLRLPSVSDVHINPTLKTCLIRADGLSASDVVETLTSMGIEASVPASHHPQKKNVSKFEGKLKHTCFKQIADKATVDTAFAGVIENYHEQQLQEYSRYKNWRQSCYMEVHPTWNPQPPINKKLCLAMDGLVDRAKELFGDWYMELHGLQDVEVIMLNSFITKYIPIEGKAEFGKHVDGAKIDGSIIIALPTNDPHDWPGLQVWDGERDLDGTRPVHMIDLQPGDMCCLDSLVWHRGLPITKGTRYVCVCFLKCKWKKGKFGDIAGTASSGNKKKK